MKTLGPVLSVSILFSVIDSNFASVSVLYDALG